MSTTLAEAPEQSIARHERYLRMDPANAPLRIALADLYHRAGRGDDALACLAQCLVDHPGQPIARSRIAAVLITQHRFDEAGVHLRALIDQGRGDAALWHNLGVALYYQRRWSEALDAFREAGERGFADRDGEASNLRYLTAAHHQLGDTAAALETGSAWAAIGGDSAVGYLALIEMDHGDMAAAHRRASALLARDPANLDAAVVEAMWATETNDVGNATTLFDRVVAAQPDNPRGWLGLGLTRLYEERNAAAVEALETATRLMPGHAASLTSLAWARFVSRDVFGAEKTFREAIRLDRGFAEAHGGLAISLVYLKRYDEARKQTRIALRLNPGTFGAIYARGALMAIDGKRAEGEAEIAQGLLRPVLADGRSLTDYLQVAMRQQIARGTRRDDDASTQ